MDPEQISYRRYWANVRTLAGEVAAGRDVSEVCDSDWWVIYTHAAHAGLMHTENEDAIFEELGGEALAGCESWADATCRMMAWALMADVSKAATPEDIERAEELARECVAGNWKVFDVDVDLSNRAYASDDPSAPLDVDKIRPDAWGPFDGDRDYLADEMGRDATPTEIEAFDRAYHADMAERYSAAVDAFNAARA